MINTEKRDRRLTVMSAALEMHRVRVANVARRNAPEARTMRFARDAGFLIPQVKFDLARAAQIAAAEENIRKSQADMMSRMTPGERAARCRAILAEIDALQFKPLGIRIAPLRAQLEAELALYRVEVIA